MARLSGSTDVSAANLLVVDGRLNAVIDFGCAGVGDPAGELASRGRLGWRQDARHVIEELLADPGRVA